MIDLSQIPAPNVIEPLDFESLLAERKAELLAAIPEAQRTAIQSVLSIESEPLNKWLQVSAYRELVIRQRVNDAARAVMLAHAVDGDLDQLGANWGVERLIVTPADDTALPPVEAVMEANADFRRRILLRLEAFTTAGSEAAYMYHALSASGQVRDVSVDSPTPGFVVVYVLSRVGDGTTGTELLEKVRAALSSRTVRPLTDNVSVLSASVVHYTIDAELIVDRGSDSEVVRQAALAATQAYADSVHRLDADPSISGNYRALHQPGVLRATLVEPADDIMMSVGQAAYCAGISITAAVEE
ncbi:baseplate assembly protein [Variovorax boronicumulans]|uniref:Baseplate assembly protein n=1 Tax=Variovorax boronicumulans TaxID=436515 RepID=A0A250DTF2_9BURK|nr:baseplate J/gp47 family protein [Variovorax boronicumulans]ATA57213.1 baseplate assembly protein [Variovorax boronicumulans]